MKPLKPMSIKFVISLLRLWFINAFSVLADLSAVGNFPIVWGLNNAASDSHK